jgi:hypothetical protein
MGCWVAVCVDTFIVGSWRCGGGVGACLVSVLWGGVCLCGGLSVGGVAGWCVGVPACLSVGCQGLSNERAVGSRGGVCLT